MSDVDWNEAPEWASRAVKFSGENDVYWAGCGNCQKIGGAIVYVMNKDDYEILSIRPDDKWQEGEERMDNIAQNGNDGHYVEVPKTDNVNSPEHYQSEDGIECIDAIRAALGKDGFISHCRGTAIKYAWRSGKKANHAEDLRKAAWYLEKAASELDK